MTRKKNPGDERLLTEVELELMQIIWRLGECTVKDVVEALPKGRELAYTSVATMLKILEKKKVLASRKGDKAHTYRPLLSKAEYEATSVNHLVNNLFDGEPSSLVMKLINEADLSSEEFKAIRKLLNERIRDV